MSLSKTRVIILGVSFALSYTSWGLLLSLLPPFYPTEAEEKGATPSQYGFVFGICNLAAFVFAPIFGHYGDKIGPRTLFKIGAITNALFGLVFGASYSSLSSSCNFLPPFFTCCCTGLSLTSSSSYSSSSS